MKEPSLFEEDYKTPAFSADQEAFMWALEDGVQVYVQAVLDADFLRDLSVQHQHELLRHIIERGSPELKAELAACVRGIVEG
jgi:hypothetical protein